MKAQRRMSLLTVGALVGVLLAPTGIAAAANAATLEPSGIETGMQIDGDKTGGTPPNTFDWNSFLTAPAPDGSYTFTPTGPYTTAQGNLSSGILDATFEWDNGSLAGACPQTGTDASGSPGSQTPNTNPWAPGPANVNGKGDICSTANAYEVVTDAAGVRHAILYSYWTRLVGNGSLSILQNLEGPELGRCDDILVAFNYESQLGTVVVEFREWQPSANDDCANPNGAGEWVNTGRTVDFDWAVGVRTEGPLPVGNQPQATFGEFAVDLTTAGLFSPEECSTYTISEALTRTGSDFGAQVEDYVVPENPLVLANCSTLTVTKEVEPEGFQSDDTFDYTVDRANGGIVLPDDENATEINGTIGIGETDTIENVLAAANYRLVEDADEPWALQSIVCTSVVPGTGQVQTFTLTDPDDVFTIYPASQTDCVITNATSTVTVQKETDPDGSTADFAFDIGGNDATLSDGESATFAFAPGTDVDIAETIPDGWASDPDIDCDADFTTDGASAQVTTVAGENITCTFTNTQLGTIVISKEAFGTPDDSEFEFTGTWTSGSPALPADGSFSIVAETGDGTNYYTTFTNVQPGDYSVSELAGQHDTQLGSLICTIGGQDEVFADPTASFTLAPGDTVSCYFVNVTPGRILVIKETDPFEYDEDFPFAFGPVGEEPTQLFTLNPLPNQATWDSGTLEPGSYDVSEVIGQLPAGWSLTDIDCDANEGSDWDANVSDGVATVDLGVDGVVQCIFTNTAEPAQLTIDKTADGVADGFPWSFNFRVTNEDSNTSTTVALTSENPSVTFTDIVPGDNYTVEELTPEGWTSTLDCDAGEVIPESQAWQFTATPEQSITCDANNEAIPASIELDKSVAGVTDDFDWSFDFTLDPAEGVTPGATQTISGTGPSTESALWENLLPGESYTLTETGTPGWTAGAIVCSGVDDSDPQQEGFQFIAKPGLALDCAVTNTPTPASLGITKTALGADDTFQFLLTPLSPVGEAIVGNATTSGGTGVATFDGLVPGTVFSLTELEVAGWVQESFTCSVSPAEGEPEPIDLAGFIVLPGDVISCSAKNSVVNAPLEFAKTVLGSPVKQSDGSLVVNYALTVYNPGPLEDAYDLDDTLNFGSGITVVSATASSADGVPVNPAWNGSTTVRIATAVAIGADVTHTYNVAVRVTVPPMITTDAADCSGAPGEPTGLLNGAALTFGDTTVEASACAPVPATLPATGVTLSALWVAIALLTGGAVLLIIRRVRRSA